MFDPLNKRTEGTIKDTRTGWNSKRYQGSAHVILGLCRFFIDHGVRDAVRRDVARLGTMGIGRWQLVQQ
jgi:hypothetical protein